MNKQLILGLWLGLWTLGLSAQSEFYNDGSLVHLEPGALVYVEGEVFNAAGTIANEGVIELLGDWTNNASYIADVSGNVIFSGTTAADISGNMIGLNDFYQLTISKNGLTATDRQVTLQTGIEVGDVLTFTDGRIVTGIHRVYVKNPAPSSVVGHSLPGAAVDDRYVQGILERSVVNPGAMYAFPVGDDPAGRGYQLIQAELPTPSTTQTLSASFQVATPVSVGDIECAFIYDCVLGTHGEWLLIPDQGTPTFNIQAVPRNFSTACNAGPYTLMTGGQLVGTACVNFAGLIDPVNGTFIPRENVSNPSPIAVVGASGTAFPVELLTFEGHPEGQTAVLNWLTDREVNNDYFELERSADGEDFLALGQRKGQGTTDEMTAYEFVDEFPFSGINYYRLRQVDFDGSFLYSQTIQVRFEDGEPSLTVSPNPFHNQLEISWPEKGSDPATFALFNLHGQEVILEILEDNHHTLRLDHLPEGIYYYRISQNGAQVAEGKVVRK